MTHVSSTAADLKSVPAQIVRRGIAMLDGIPYWFIALAARVPGWQRFKPLQDRLDRVATAGPRTIDPAQLRAQAARAAPNDPNEQERLFKQFLEWNKKQSRQ